jgi:hypothetical protein
MEFGLQFLPDVRPEQKSTLSVRELSFIIARDHRLRGHIILHLRTRLQFDTVCCHLS